MSWLTNQIIGAFSNFFDNMEQGWTIGNIGLFDQKRIRFLQEMNEKNYDPSFV